jgi:hypothetical protein
MPVSDDALQIINYLGGDVELSSVQISDCMRELGHPVKRQKIPYICTSANVYQRKRKQISIPQAIGFVTHLLPENEIVRSYWERKNSEDNKE